MIGVELVKDRATKVPAKEETIRLFEMTKDMGLLIGKGGIFRQRAAHQAADVPDPKPTPNFLLGTLELCFEKL